MWTRSQGQSSWQLSWYISRLSLSYKNVYQVSKQYYDKVNSSRFHRRSNSTKTWRKVESLKDLPPNVEHWHAIHEIYETYCSFSQRLSGSSRIASRINCAWWSSWKKKTSYEIILNWFLNQFDLLEIPFIVCVCKIGMVMSKLPTCKLKAIRVLDSYTTLLFPLSTLLFTPWIHVCFKATIAYRRSSILFIILVLDGNLKHLLESLLHPLTITKCVMTQQ